jgi:non-homologous end joining protein Ku
MNFVRTAKGTYLNPDGPVAGEILRVIGAAMAEAGVVGLGRLTVSRRERMVVVEPRGTGWRFSLCVPRRRFGRRSPAWPKASSTLRWS